MKNKKKEKNPPKKNVKPKEKSDKLASLFVKPNPFPLPPQPKNFKQIEYNTENSKLTLVDYNNIKFECNLFGEELPTFKPYVTGTVMFKKRKDLNYIKPIEFACDKLYHPRNRFFEGYFACPRPLSLPFINECSNPSLFIQAITDEKRIHTEKNKRVMALKIPSKENNSRLVFLTSTIAMEGNETKKYLINLINGYIEELKIENKYTLNKVTNDPNVKALKRFKKILKLNLEENVVNGKIVDKPDEKFKEEYSIITKILHQGKKEVKFTDDMYKDLYSIRTVPKVQKEKIISKDKEKKFIDTNTSSFHYKTVSTGFGVTKVNKFLNTTNSKFEDTKDNLSFCKFFYNNNFSV